MENNNEPEEDPLLGFNNMRKRVAEDEDDIMFKINDDLKESKVKQD